MTDEIASPETSPLRHEELCAAALALFSQDIPADAPVSQWHGVLQDGWTEQDMSRSLEALSRATGLDLVCVWDYDDRWGYGGDSSIYARSVRTAPDGAQRLLLQDAERAVEYLTDPNSSPDLASISRPPVSAAVEHDVPACTLSERVSRNLAWRVDRLGELG